MPFAATYMDLEVILLNEVSQTEKDKYHMLSLTCGILKKKKKDTRASLAIQQLRLHASNAGGVGSISSQDCTRCGQKIKFNFKEIQMNLCTKQK